MAGKLAVADDVQKDPGPSQRQNIVHDMLARVSAAFSNRDIQNAQTHHDSSVALKRFFEVTGANHGLRRIHEAMPHFDTVSTVYALRGVLFRLGYTTTVEDVDDRNLRSEYLPCFVQLDDGAFICVETAGDDGTVRYADPQSGETVSAAASAINGTAVFPERKSDEIDDATDDKFSWSTTALIRFRPIILSAFALSFLVSVTALATPLFVMTVFDKAIGAKSINVLVGLTVGILFIAAADYVLRVIRGQFTAYIGARLDTLINQRAFERLLFMPLSYTDGAPISAQTTRLKQVTSLREAFTGDLASAIFDAPFAVVFVIIIAIIGGHLVWIPISLIAVYVVLSVWAAPTMQRVMKRAGDARSRLYSLTVEAVSAQQAIHDLAIEDVWLRRHRKVSAESAMATMKAQQFQTLLQTISQSLVAAAGVATLCFGAALAVEGAITGGALIAVMALSWRILSPIRNIFMSTLTVFQTLQSVKQIDRLLKIPLERKHDAPPTISRSYQGDIVFDRVFFRYPSQPEPTIRSVSFNARPGEVVCLCGSAGSGKSTAIQLLIGLHKQQAGSIFVDGMDLRQLDLGEWRNSLGVMLRKSELFYGTLEQNLRLADPAATDAQLEAVATRFGVDQYYDSVLKDGLKTRYTTTAASLWPDALKKRIALCRTFVTEKPIYLLDDPADSIDTIGERALLSYIEERRGKSTIIMSTHRPSHMRIADTVVWLQAGSTRKIGAPEQVLPEMLSSA